MTQRVISPCGVFVFRAHLTILCYKPLGLEHFYCGLSLKFLQIAKDREIRGLDAFFGRFSSDKDMGNFACDKVAQKDFWPKVEPIVRPILALPSLKQMAGIRALRAKLNRVVMTAENERYIATSRVRVDLNYIPSDDKIKQAGAAHGAVNATQKYVTLERGRKKSFICAGFNPQVFYSQKTEQGVLYIYFAVMSSYPGIEVNPRYVVTDHLLQRLQQRDTEFSSKTFEDVRYFVLGQLSTGVETLRPYWVGKGNEILVRSKKGAFLGEALNVDTPSGRRPVYFLKTFVPERMLRPEQLTLSPELLLDTAKLEEQRTWLYRIAQEHPYPKFKKNIDGESFDQVCAVEYIQRTGRTDLYS